MDVKQRNASPVCARVAPATVRRGRRDHATDIFHMADDGPALTAQKRDPSTEFSLCFTSTDPCPDPEERRHDPRTPRAGEPPAIGQRPTCCTTVPRGPKGPLRAAGFTPRPKPATTLPVGRAAASASACVRPRFMGCWRSPLYAPLGAPRAAVLYWSFARSRLEWT